MSESFGSKVLAGAAWATVDRFGTMGIQFMVNLLLARLLVPSDFGIVGMLSIFIAVSQTLIDCGFSSALIQKKTPTQTDYSTIFYWNIAFSLFLYSVLFILSPAVSRFYSMPQLTDVLRTTALTLITSGIIAIQRTRLQKSLAFRSIAIVNLSAYLIGSAIALSMAYYGYGVWSLVIMQLVISGVSAVAFLAVSKWYPSICFSKRSFRELFGFSGYILSANLLQTICQNLQGIIIGKRFSATQMGYFSQAYKLDQVTSYSIPQVIVQVMYPVYSSVQDDMTRLTEIIKMNLRVITLIVLPFLSVLILSAGYLIPFLYGDEWIPAIPYFRILCVGGVFVSLQNINFYAVAALGKSRALFKWSFYKWGFLICALIVGMNFGMNGIMWSMVASNLNIFLVNAALVSKFTGLTVRSQLSAILPVWLSGITAGVAATLVVLSGINIGLAVLVFAGVFIIICFACRLKALQDMRMLATRIFHRHAGS